MRILAVDDDPVMFDLLGLALEASGFEDITFAATAQDALELVEVAVVPYDVFLLDVMLPGTSGIEVCAKLRTYPRYRATPVLMITASRDGDMMTRAFDAGATDFVSKPFDALELVTRIRLAALLNDTQKREQLNSAAMEELARLTEVSFDEPFEMKARPGMNGLLTLENEFLRQAETSFRMMLFSVQIDNAVGFYRGSRPAQFRAGVDAVCHAVSDVIDAKCVRFAYAGRGMIFGLAHEGASLDPAELQRLATGALAQRWDGFTTGLSNPPTLGARRIDGPEVWSGKMAADVMHGFQGRADLKTQANPSEVDCLFERLSVRISGG